MSDLDKLPTPEEMEAVFGTTTSDKNKKPTRQYPVNSGPRAIRIDPASNLELPPEPITESDDDSDKDRDRPRRRRKVAKNEEGFEMPDKFKGKSPEEIAASYAELERKYGTIANEVGHMRNIVERLATSKRKDDLDETDSVVITNDDLLENPTEAIKKVARAAAKEGDENLSSRVELMEAERVMREFETAHPTYREDIQNPDFQEFFRESKYRLRLAQRAEQGDVEAADELWTAWEEVRDQYESDDRDDTDFEEDLKDAGTRKRDLHLERGGRGGADVKAFGKRIYSSAEILKMRLEDPDRYYSPQMQAILAAAYSEGRVK